MGRDRGSAWLVATTSFKTLSHTPCGRQVQYTVRSEEGNAEMQAYQVRRYFYCLLYFAAEAGVDTDALALPMVCHHHLHHH